MARKINWRFIFREGVLSFKKKVLKLQNLRGKVFAVSLVLLVFVVGWPSSLSLLHIFVFMTSRTKNIQTKKLRAKICRVIINKQLCVWQSPAFIFFLVINIRVLDKFNFQIVETKPFFSWKLTVTVGIHKQRWWSMLLMITLITHYRRVKTLVAFIFYLL